MKQINLRMMTAKAKSSIVHKLDRNGENKRFKEDTAKTLKRQRGLFSTSRSLEDDRSPFCLPNVHTMPIISHFVVVI